MDDLNKAEVILGGDPQGVAFDSDSADHSKETSAEADLQTKDETQETTSAGVETPGENDDALDFESVLLASEQDEKSTSIDTGEKKEEEKQQQVTSDRLAALKSIAEQLDGVPENQDANFNRLRKLNRELLRTEIGREEAAERLASYGSTEKIEEALNLLDGLSGYDTVNGVPSTHKFAETLARSNPEIAYNAALNLMMHEAPDGTPFAEIYTRRVLGLDPARLMDFQAISRGELPEGYEGLITNSEDLSKIPADYHDAFKRLTPKMQEIVIDGSDNYATNAEKAEAMRILQDSQNVISNEKAQAIRAAAEEQNYRAALEAKAVEIEAFATESIGSKIAAGLDKLVFSSDEAVNLTMREGVETRLFDLAHENPYIRQKAEKFFSVVGVDIKAERPKIDYWFNRLSENIDIETVAELKHQSQAAEKARSIRTEAEKRLAAIALSLIAKVARKTGANLAQRAATASAPPTGQLPVTKGLGSSSSNDNGKQSITWREAAAATKAGKALL